MPIYEYECRRCGRHHEIMQKITDKPLTECADCGGEMKKMISNTSFVLKGTGWYATDYSAGKSSSAGPDKEKEKTADAKPGKTGDNKTETKAEKKPPTEVAVSK